nr:LOW QUALITY PROTEIN: putative uncharacterized protein encoded by LINC00176 [Aotus nancymaae]
MAGPEAVGGESLRPAGEEEAAVTWAEKAAGEQLSLDIPCAPQACTLGAPAGAAGDGAKPRPVPCLQRPGQKPDSTRGLGTAATAWGLLRRPEGAQYPPVHLVPGSDSAQGGGRGPPRGPGESGLDCGCAHRGGDAAPLQDAAPAEPAARDAPCPASRRPEAAPAARPGRRRHLLGEALRAARRGLRGLLAERPVREKQRGRGRSWRRASFCPPVGDLGPSLDAARVPRRARDLGRARPAAAGSRKRRALPTPKASINGAGAAGPALPLHASLGLGPPGSAPRRGERWRGTRDRHFPSHRDGAEPPFPASGSRGRARDAGAAGFLHSDLLQPLGHGESTPLLS